MKPVFTVRALRWGHFLLLALFAILPLMHAEPCAQDPNFSSVSVGRIASNLFELRLNFALPNIYLVERSTNLLHWEPVATNVVQDGAAAPVRLAFAGNAGFARVTQRDPPHVPGRLLLRFTTDSTPAEQQAALQSVGATNTLQTIQTPAMLTNGTPAIVIARTDGSAPAAARALATNRVVRMVEPDWIYSTQMMPNDPQFTATPPISYWNLGCSTCSGSLSSGPGSQAAAAWSMGYVGSTSVLVGIVDSGVEFAHPDLAQNMWVNSAESNGTTGMDDDNNGYKDDERGWNFLADNASVFAGGSGSLVDTHGTHVAGIIGARGDNGVGQAGVCWQVTMVPAKFLEGAGGPSSAAALAIDYLIDLKRKGANLVAINASWGGAAYSWQLHEAILRAAKAGILFVAAAGNCGANLDLEPFYPACYDTTKQATGSMNGPETAANYDAVISVAAIDSNGYLPSFSNYGSQTVDLAAPGVGIISTQPGGYAAKEGTSMAAAHVTGALALYAAAYPNTTAAQRRARLLTSTTSSGFLSGQTATGGRLDVARLMTPLPGCSPPDCILFVDRGYAGTLENGCPATPYKTVLGAYGVALDDCVLRIAAGTYSIGTLPLPNKAVLFEPNGGSVLLQSQ